MTNNAQALNTSLNKIEKLFESKNDIRKKYETLKSMLKKEFSLTLDNSASADLNIGKIGHAVSSLFGNKTMDFYNGVYLKPKSKDALDLSNISDMISQIEKTTNIKFTKSKDGFYYHADAEKEFCVSIEPINNKKLGIYFIRYITEDEAVTEGILLENRDVKDAYSFVFKTAKSQFERIGFNFSEVKSRTPPFIVENKHMRGVLSEKNTKDKKAVEKMFQPGWRGWQDLYEDTATWIDKNSAKQKFKVSASDEQVFEVALERADEKHLYMLIIGITTNLKAEVISRDLNQEDEYEYDEDEERLLEMFRKLSEMKRHRSGGHNPGEYDLEVQIDISYAKLDRKKLSKNRR